LCGQESPLSQAHYRSEWSEWIYIDRDICGISLHEYAPNDPSCGDFVSSSFGRLFCADLQRLELAGKGDEYKMDTEEDFSREALRSGDLSITGRKR